MAKEKINKKKSVTKEKPSMETPILIRHDPEAQEVKVNFEPGRMVFQVKGQKFYLGEGTAGFLFGRQVQLEFEKPAGKVDDFSSFNTVDFLAQFKVASNHLRGTNEVAKFLRMEEEQLRRWLNSDGKYRKQLIGTEEYAALVTKYENQYFPKAPEEKKKPIKLDLKKIALMMNKGLSLAEIASTLGHRNRWQEFIEAYTEKGKEILKIRNQLRAKE